MSRERSSRSKTQKLSGVVPSLDVQHSNRMALLQKDSADRMLAPSPNQLRDLWYFDNMCAHKYMGMPLRQCSSIEPPDGPHADPLPEAMISLLKKQITDMWRKMSTLLEIFYEDDKPEQGYRLRVKPDIPIKVSLKPTDQLIIGWKAMIPQIETSPSSHLYLRSDMAESNQYLGGPVSYCNWARTKECSITVKQISHGSARHLVRAESKFLSPGRELLWDYGLKKMPDFGNKDWFQPECCSITANPKKKLCNPKKVTMEVYKELCVLCGQPYKANRRDWTNRKCQKKVHFLNSHADFLGTDWDGCNPYDPSFFTVDFKRAQIACERLCFFLKRLNSNSWKVVPACVVMSKQERETLDAEILMRIFFKRVYQLRKLGSIVVRGNTTATMVEHLHPIQASSWSDIFPRSVKPHRQYAIPKVKRNVLTPQITDESLQDVLMVLNVQDEEESDEDM